MPDTSEKIVFQLVDQDIQDVAAEEIGRRLTDKELKAATEIVEKRFDYWYEFLCEAVREVAQDGI